MYWLIQQLEQDYGKKVWYGLSDEHQIRVIAAFSKDVVGAIDKLRKINKKKKDEILRSR